jgi:GNAT superfamily N-acetyltransferase
MWGRNLGLLRRSEMIEKASIDMAGDILSVINISNREAYGSMIPQEHCKEPLLSLEALLPLFDTMTFYICRRQGNIVGVAALSLDMQATGRIHWVYILPEYQRKGIGAALVRHVEVEAVRKGLRALRLFTVGAALWAIEFYQKLGYRLIGKVDRPLGFDVVMEKKLEDQR